MLIAHNFAFHSHALSEGGKHSYLLFSCFLLRNCASARSLEVPRVHIIYDERYGPAAGESFHFYQSAAELYAHGGLSCADYHNGSTFTCFQHPLAFGLTQCDVPVS